MEKLCKEIFPSAINILLIAEIVSDKEKLLERINRNFKYQRQLLPDCAKNIYMKYIIMHLL